MCETKLHCDLFFFLLYFINYEMLFFIVCKGDWGILFLKILAKCHSKKDRILFCFAWNYLNTPWRSSIISSLRSVRSFNPVYFVLNLARFCLLISLLCGYFSLSSFWKFIYIYIDCFLVFCSKDCEDSLMHQISGFQPWATAHRFAIYNLHTYIQWNISIQSGVQHKILVMF